MSTEANKAIVRRLFEEIMDRGDTGAVAEVFAEDAVMHLPGTKEPIVGLDGITNAVAGAAKRYRDMKTTLHLLIAEGDLVACRLSHDVVFDRDWTTPIGTYDVSGKSLEYFANVFFRVRDGKIIEQWIVRDELGMMLRLGLLKAEPTDSPK